MRDHLLRQFKAPLQAINNEVEDALIAQAVCSPHLWFQGLILGSEFLWTAIVRRQRL
jgi:hypothetical protein